jgi:hypothetical protein
MQDVSIYLNNDLKKIDCFFSLNKLIIIVNMEVQTCAYTSLNVSNSDSDYGKINITSVIMCFLIIYSTALSIVLSIKQLIQVIKEEELLNEDEEEEKEEEEVIKEEEVIEEEDKEKNEEELLLTSYNTKERALALQTAYDERAKLTFEKWREAHYNLFKIKRELVPHGGEGFSYTENANMYRTFMMKMQEEYLETNEKLTRLEAFNALKKARTLDLNRYKEFIHLFNS